MFAFDPTIPIIDREVYAGHYTDIAFDRGDPRFREPLVPLESVGVAYRSHHARDDGGNWPYHRAIEGARKDMWLRRSAAEKLLAVNVRLRPFGVELFVLDGYRGIECQRGLWEFYLAEGARLQSRQCGKLRAGPRLRSHAVRRGRSGHLARA